jgi:hypothetical protein
LTRRAVILFWQLLILALLLVIWQWGFEWSKALLPKAYVPKFLEPYFIAKPSAIWESFLKLGCLRQEDGFVACLRRRKQSLACHPGHPEKHMVGIYLRFGFGHRCWADPRPVRSPGADFRTLYRRAEFDSLYRIGASDHPHVRAR